MWGDFKDFIYKPTCPDTRELKQRIIAAIHSITTRMLSNTWNEIKYRLDKLPAIQKSHTTSPESPLIFILIHKLFHYDSVSELKQVALNKCGFTEDDYTAFLIFISGFLSNFGNYRGFGDTKFIPNLPKDKFEKLVLSSQFAAKHLEDAQQLLSNCLQQIYSLKDKERCLGFPYKNMSDYIYPNNTPIIQLDCEAAFNELTEEEKHYAHFLSKAFWCGGLIDLLLFSVRDVSEACGCSKSHVWNILNVPGAYPYRPQLVQEFLPGDVDRRFNFCNFIMNKLETDPSFVNDIR
ncbi:Dipeptidyl peptidase 3 [Araneus ventricosus]|uniref:Dipeptidyl peptidase 3 n=1 Tax=Araneus ventricosus TaxID=182803 RepID=A0A4Y2LP16_ARAVE|nr:Dipeptidyl peptidase 3 [Araneus ventricosus]